MSWWRDYFVFIGTEFFLKRVTFLNFVIVYILCSYPFSPSAAIVIRSCVSKGWSQRPLPLPGPDGSVIDRLGVHISEHVQSISWHHAEEMTVRESKVGLPLSNTCTRFLKLIQLKYGITTKLTGLVSLCPTSMSSELQLELPIWLYWATVFYQLVVIIDYVPCNVFIPITVITQRVQCDVLIAKDSSEWVACICGMFKMEVEHLDFRCLRKRTKAGHVATTAQKVANEWVTIILCLDTRTHSIAGTQHIYRMAKDQNQKETVLLQAFKPWKKFQLNYVYIPDSYWRRETLYLPCEMVIHVHVVFVCHQQDFKTMRNDKNN